MSSSKGARTSNKRCGGRPKTGGVSRHTKSEDRLTTIDRLLQTSVQTTLNGKATKITALEAILYQLLQKEISGDTQASRVLAKYEELRPREPSSKLQITFVENDYTRAFAGNEAEGETHG